MRRNIVLQMLATRYAGRIHRTCWAIPRSKNMLSDAIAGRLGNNWWKENLRMSRDTFYILCNELHPYAQKEYTNMRSPVTVEERVAVTVWKLATNIEYRSLASLFGLGRSTVGKIVLETCNIMATKLLSRYVRFPEGTRLREVVEGFEVCWGFPQVAGAIDGTHIPIISPLENPSDYYNRKGFYSIIMQAVVDFRGLFLDTYIGWPGKVHDARVFSNSSVYRKGREGTLLPAWKRQINGVEVCNLMMYNKFIFASDSTADTWRSSLPYTTMADETVCYHSQHDYRTKTVQLSSKQSSNAS